MNVKELKASFSQFEQIDSTANQLQLIGTMKHLKLSIELTIGFSYAFSAATSASRMKFRRSTV